MIATLMDWLLFFLAASLKGSVILLVALLASWRMRRSSAAARHAVIAIGLGAFLLLPIAQLLLPRWTLPILPRAPVEWTITTVEPLDVSPVATLPPEADMPAPEARTAAAPEASATEAVAANDSAPFAVSWVQLLVFLWLAGGAVVALRLVAGIAGVWLLERRATMITDGGWLQTAHALAQRLGLTRGVTLLRGDRGSVPLTWGVLQPVVWLPADATGWDDERRSVVLAHELAHVKRRDAITQWIANITLALHWFNPLAWIAARQLRAERERACDEAVLALGTQPTVYAEHLLAMVRSIRGAGGPAAAMAMARRSQFEGRLLAILDGATGRQRMGGARLAAIGGVALLITVPLAGMSPVTRSAASAADLPGISAEAGGYPAAIGPEMGEASSPASARDEWSRRPPAATAQPDRARTEVIGPPSVRLPPSAEARSTADAVLRDSAAAGRVLTQAASTRDSALLLDIIAAASEMSSSSDRAIILVRIAQLPPLEPPVLVALLAASKGISSSAAKTSVLTAVLKHQPAVLRVATAQYLDAVESVSSSSARSSLLGPAITTPGLTPQLAGAVLQAIGRVSSSTDRTHAISAAIRDQPVVFGAAAPALFAVIDSIPSSTDRASLLSAILERETLSEDVLVRVIRSAGKIPGSDRTHLLIAVARRGTPTGAAKTAFLEAASAVPSSTDRANVLAALLPPGAESTPAPSTSSRRSSTYERHWYIVNDTTSGIPRRLVLMWQGMELRNGAIAEAAPRARLELEETREVPGAGKSEQRKVIVSMRNGQPVYDYCIDDETQAFDAEARSWFASTLRAAERARR